jgi:RNA polymerase sigma factor (sigma-70 family)
VVSDHEDWASELARDVLGALGNLSAREEEVVRLRFGIGHRMHDRKEVALCVGLTRSGVRQIENRALRKLRSAAVDEVRALESDERRPRPLAAVAEGA